MTKQPFQICRVKKEPSITINGKLHFPVQRQKKEMKRNAQEETKRKQSGKKVKSKEVDPPDKIRKNIILIRLKSFQVKAKLQSFFRQ